MERDSRIEFAADVRRREVVSPNWPRLRMLSVVAAALGMAGFGLSRLSNDFALIEFSLYAMSAICGLGVIVLVQWKRFFVQKPPLTESSGR